MTASGACPEEAVIAAVKPGCSAILNLTPDQRALMTNDQEGLDALSLLCHLLFARDAAGLRGALPLTEQFTLHVARRLGLGLGRNGVRRAVRRLATAGVVAPASSYRQKYTNAAIPSGFRVRLWNVTPVVWIENEPRRFARGRPHPAYCQASVAGRTSRKVPQWWCDPLMGNPDDCPPHGVPPGVLHRWASEKHFRGERGRERAFYRGPAT